MNTRRSLFALILTFALVLSACAPQRSPTTDRDVSSSGGADGFLGFVGEQAEVPPAEPMLGQAAGAPNQTTVERLVIRNATLTLVVVSPVEASQQIASLANGLGGYVVSSNTTQASVDADGNKIMRANITVRVPAEQLDAALAQIRGLAVEVRTENITGQDVTAEYTDLESRLRNLEAAEAQLVNIMDGATRTEDVLSVFNQLVYIREQIEQVKGQMEYYSQAAALSAISIELLPDALSQPITVAGWRPEGVAKEALEALISAFQGLATIVIWLGIYVLPLALVIGLPIYLGVRFFVRRLRKPRPTAAA